MNYMKGNFVTKQSEFLTINLASKIFYLVRLKTNLK